MRENSLTNKRGKAEENQNARLPRDLPSRSPPAPGGELAGITH